MPTFGIDTPELFGHQRQADDVARLSLVRSHAERRVPLQVLDRLITLARRQGDVVGGDVVLQVDEALGTRGRGRNGPERLQCTARLRHRARCSQRDGSADARTLGRSDAGAVAFDQRGRQVEAAIGGPGRQDGQRRRVGHEGGKRIVVAQLAACLREQVHRGIPAARYADQVARHPLGRAAGMGRDLDGGDVLFATHIGNDRVAHQRQTRLARLRRQAA